MKSLSMPDLFLKLSQASFISDHCVQLGCLHVFSILVVDSIGTAQRLSHGGYQLAIQALGGEVITLTHISVVMYFTHSTHFVLSPVVTEAAKRLVLANHTFDTCSANGCFVGSRFGVSCS